MCCLRKQKETVRVPEDNQNEYLSTSNQSGIDGQLGTINKVK